MPPAPRRSPTMYLPRRRSESPVTVGEFYARFFVSSRLTAPTSTSEQVTEPDACLTLTNHRPGVSGLVELQLAVPPTTGELKGDTRRQRDQRGEFAIGTEATGRVLLGDPAREGDALIRVRLGVRQVI